MDTITVLYVGGPVAGRVERVGVTAGEGPPQMRVFQPSPLFVGASDVPVPVTPVRYSRQPADPDSPLTEWLYVWVP